MSNNRRWLHTWYTYIAATSVQSRDGNRDFTCNFLTMWSNVEQTIMTQEMSRHITFEILYAFFYANNLLNPNRFRKPHFPWHYVKISKKHRICGCLEPISYDYFILVQGVQHGRVEYLFQNKSQILISIPGWEYPEEVFFCGNLDSINVIVLSCHNQHLGKGMLELHFNEWKKQICTNWPITSLEFF